MTSSPGAAVLILVLFGNSIHIRPGMAVIWLALAIEYFQAFTFLVIKN